MDSTYIDPEHYGTIDVILAGVSQATEVPSELIKGKRRYKELVIPRHITMYLACKHTEFSLKNIGKQMLGRDHTTVIHSRNYVQDIFDLYNKEPLRVSPEDKKIMRLTQHLDYKLNMAKLAHEKIKSRRANDSGLSPEGENGQTERASCEPCPAYAVRWDFESVRIRRDSERVTSDSLHHGESCRGESRIVDTHFGDNVHS